jgi:hypothetical protein
MTLPAGVSSPASTVQETITLLTRLEHTGPAEQPQLDYERRVTKDDVTVVLPVVNEEEGISVVIDELHENGYRNILVVDGYSTDLTAKVARRKDVPVIEQHGKDGRH